MQDRRSTRQVSRIETRPLKFELKNLNPFVVVVKDGDAMFEVPGLSRPQVLSRVKRRIDSATATATVLVDSVGCQHYLLEAICGGEGWWAFTKPPQGMARGFHDEIPFTSIRPDGVEEVARLNRHRVGMFKEGSVLQWNYAFARAWQYGKGTGQLGVLAADGIKIPVARPLPKHRENWPGYVSKLMDTYKQESWDRLIAGLEGKYPEDLFPRGVPIAKSVVAHLEGKPPPKIKDTSPARAGVAHCFDGSITGLKLQSEGEVTLQSGVHWGESGHLAWIIRYKGQVVAIIVDKPAVDSAAWVFTETEAAAQLLHPNIELDWRERLAGMKEKAVYYCPHYEGWRRRLEMVVLLVLGKAGCSAAESLFEANATKDDEWQRAARLANTYWTEYQKS